MNSDYQYLLQYTDFQSKCVSIFKGIPISELDTVKGMLRASGQKYRIRYRGPRFGIPTDTRSKSLKQSTCLKVNATTFSVY